MINAFPDYDFVENGSDNKPHNMYRGIDLGFGGYVYAEPGMYGNVALLDVQSMHPSSIINMKCFGEYTKRYKDIYDARIAIKHKDYDGAKKLMNGLLTPYLTDKKQAGDLSKALKLCLNGTYGLTSANFDNPFRDPRNKNNIVALRGALFMKTLQDEVQSMGYTVCHIKTDSIKVADADERIIKFIMEFGEKYGYTFEHEATYEKICLVNDAVYIAKYKEGGEGWTATGAQFQIPYVFKKLFSGEDILFEDLCETKSVKTALYLDMNESLPEDEHDYQFIGKVGNFCPIKSGFGGGLLCRQGTDKDGNIKYHSATGAKGYRWLEAERVYMVPELRKNIDTSYYDRLVDDAVDAISKYGDFEWFRSDDPYDKSELWFERNCPF